MIRAALLSLGFLGITGLLIAVQPTSNLGRDTSNEPVTREDTSLAAAAQAIVPAPDVPEIGLISERDALPVKPQQAPTRPTPVTDVERIVAAALGGGQSDAYIDAMLGDAAARDMLMPVELITADGRVDSLALIAALSQHASAPETAPQGSYLVQPGDSLASIAYRSYGETRLAPRIAEANRMVLERSSALLVGTRLIIPPES